MVENSLGDGREISAEDLQRLRETLLDMFGGLRYDEVTIREVCKRACVSPKTIYKYFGTKDQLIYSCIQPDMDELNQQLAKIGRKTSLDASKKVVAIAKAWCDFYMARHRLATVVFLRIPSAYWLSNPHFVQTAVIQANVQVLKEGQKAGLVNKDVPADVLLDMMTGASHRMMARWLLLEPNNGSAIKRMLVRGLTSMAAP